MEALEATLSPYELERGKPIPSFNHSVVQMRLGFQLMLQLDKTHTVTSEVKLELNGQKTVPDLAVFAKRTPDMQYDTLGTHDVPLTTIEILSPKQELESLLDKARAFLAAGVRSCWVVLPGISTIAVFTGPSAYRSFAHGSTDVVRDEQLGIEIPLLDLFG